MVIVLTTIMMPRLEFGIHGITCSLVSRLNELLASPIADPAFWPTFSLLQIPFRMLHITVVKPNISSLFLKNF